MKKGTRITYRSRMGGALDPAVIHFSGAAEPGDEGIYISRHPSKYLANKGWHVTKTLTDPPLYVPCTLYQLEVMSKK